MRGFVNTQRFLIPVSTVSARNAWHNDSPFYVLNTTKSTLRHMSLAAYASETKNRVLSSGYVSLRASMCIHLYLTLTIYHYILQSSSHQFITQGIVNCDILRNLTLLNNVRSMNQFVIFNIYSSHFL